MASLASSPISTAPTSAVSSPEIKVTDDHGKGTALHLPGPMAEQVLNEPPRSRSITIEVPTASRQTELGARPASVRSASSEAALEPFPTSKLAATLAPSEPLINGKTKAKELNRSSSSQTSLRMSLRSMASSSLLSSKKKQHATESDRSSSVAHSGTSSPIRTIDTPEVKTIFAKKTCPDLDAVSRALESLKAQAREPKDPLVLNLRSLEKKIQGAREDCAKLLTRAMQARDQERYEICRALCIQIVQNQHSKTETKVYAYNILSTQASPGQVMNFLNEAAKLVKQCEEGPEKGKLEAVVAMLQERAMAKESERDAAVANPRQGSLVEREGRRSPGAQQQQQQQRGREGSLRPQLGEKKAGNGYITPKSEKIIEWAAPEKGGNGAA